MEADIHSAQR